MWSLINIKETVNMQMWYLVIYFKIAGVLKTNIFGEYGLDVFFSLRSIVTKQIPCMFKHTWQ